MKVCTVSMRMWGGGGGWDADIRSYHLEQETHKHNEVIMVIPVSHGLRYGNEGRKMLIKMWYVVICDTERASNLFKLERDN